MRLRNRYTHRVQPSAAQLQAILASMFQSDGATSIPASATIPAAAAKQQDNKNDDEKCGHVHDASPCISIYPSTTTKLGLQRFQEASRGSTPVYYMKVKVPARSQDGAIKGPTAGGKVSNTSITLLHADCIISIGTGGVHLKRKENIASPHLSLSCFRIVDQSHRTEA